MSGYAAPPIPVVRVGFIGLGDRGSEAVKRLSFIEGVEITAIVRFEESCTGRIPEVFDRVLADLLHGNLQVMILPGKNWLSFLTWT